MFNYYYHGSMKSMNELRDRALCHTDNVIVLAYRESVHSSSDIIVITVYTTSLFFSLIDADS